MKKFAMSYLFVVLATTLLLALLKLAGSPATTWGWVAFPILGSLVMWLLFIGLVTTVGLIWPTYTWKGNEYLKPGDPGPPRFRYEEYQTKTLRVSRDIRLDPHALDAARYAQQEAYYRKALALELATLAHDTPGFIEWEKRGETLIGELKILVKNEQ